MKSPSRHSLHQPSMDDPLIHIQGSAGFLYDGTKLYVRLIAPGVVSGTRVSWRERARKKAA